MPLKARPAPAQKAVSTLGNRIDRIIFLLKGSLITSPIEINSIPVKGASKRTDKENIMSKKNLTEK